MHTNKTSFRESAAKQKTSALLLAPTWQQKHLALMLAKYLSVYFLYSSLCYYWTRDPETKVICDILLLFRKAPKDQNTGEKYLFHFQNIIKKFHVIYRVALTLFLAHSSCGNQSLSV